MNDSISEAIRLLESECDEINRAIVRLSLRKEKLHDAIRLLRDRSSTPLTDTVQPMSEVTSIELPSADIDNHTPTPAPVTTPSTSHLVRETLKSAVDWMSVTDIRSAIDRPQTQVQAALQYCVGKGLVERRDLVIADDDNDIRMPIAKYQYRWIAPVDHRSLSIVRQG